MRRDDICMPGEFGRTLHYKPYTFGILVSNCKEQNRCVNVALTSFFTCSIPHTIHSQLLLKAMSNIKISHVGMHYASFIATRFFYFLDFNGRAEVLNACV